jgi:tRNA U34 5-methylaminomethyl-2-thiouridine-forming methyltransferase MnmC
MATFSEAYLSPLSPEESEHLQTRAAIPYRDPSLTDTPSQIIARREEEQALSNLENTSQWKKRWRL